MISKLIDHILKDVYKRQAVRYVGRLCTAPFPGSDVGLRLLQFLYLRSATQFCFAGIFGFFIFQYAVDRLSDARGFRFIHPGRKRILDVYKRQSPKIPIGR